MRPFQTSSLLVLFAAAATGCAQYSVRRAALVPQPMPTFRSGQPMDGVAELGVGLGTLARLQPPAEGDSDAGLVVPRTQAAGNLRFRPTRNFDLGLIMERGFAGGATSLAEDQPVPDDGDATGFGTSLFYSIETRDPGFRIGLAADLLAYNIPNVEYRTCFENCDGVPYTEVVDKHTVVGVYSLSVVPSLRAGPVTGHFGVTVRNHPTVARGGIEGPYDSDDVQAGPANVILSGGIEYQIANGPSAALVVYYDTAEAPVRYAPTVAALITVPLSRPTTTR